MLAFVLFFLIVMCAFAGMAGDIGRAIAAKAELQSALDAAVLAGAGKLYDPVLYPAGGTAVTYPLAGSAARAFATQNPSTAGTPNPTWNLDNSGDVKVGVWNTTTKTWTSSLTPIGGLPVNGVSCQWTTTIPTSFLGVLGFPTLTVSALSTALVGAPASPPAGAPVMPLGLPQCGFDSSSNRCGALVTTNQTGGNAAWVDIGTASCTGGFPQRVQCEVQQAAAGTAPPQSLTAPMTVDSSTGNLGNVFNALASCNPGTGICTGAFVTAYTQSLTQPITVKNHQGTPTYIGPGWKVVVPVVSYSDCASNFGGGGSLNVLTWTYMTIVQVISGGQCAVPNPGYLGDAPWNSACQGNGGTAVPRNGNLNVVYGYYSCEVINAPTASTAAPPAAFATHPKLVR